MLHAISELFLIQIVFSVKPPQKVLSGYRTFHVICLPGCGDNIPITVISIWTRNYVLNYEVLSIQWSEHVKAPIVLAFKNEEAVFRNIEEVHLFQVGLSVLRFR